jgi:hypothetical protein
MKLPHISGNYSKNVNVSSYRVDWDGKCKSKFQFNVKQFFREFWKDDDCYEEFPVLGTLLSCDLINFTLGYAIESDGKFHKTYSPFHHKTRMGFLASLKRDQKKDEWLKGLGLRVIRISEEEIKNLTLEWVKEKFGNDITEKFNANE